jgi:hypothetical protein
MIIRAILLALGLLSLTMMKPPTAHAEPLTAGINSSYGSGIDINFRGNITTGYAGPFTASLNGGLAFYTYCIDLDHVLEPTTFALMGLGISGLCFHSRPRRQYAC